MDDYLSDATNPMKYLRAEHEKISQFLKTCIEGEQVAMVRQTKQPLLEELKIHEALEHDIFYPFIRRVLPDSLVARPAVENLKMLELASMIENTDPKDAEFYDVLNQLVFHFERHVFEEEQFVFLNLEGRDPDFEDELLRVTNVLRKRRSQLSRRTGRETSIADDGALNPAGEAIDSRESNIRGGTALPIDYQPNRELSPDLQRYLER